MWSLFADGTNVQLFLDPPVAQLNAGIGPRVLPSHASQPIAHPLENQKHDCPFCPVKFLPGSDTAASSLGIGHHGSNGTGVGTLPPHGSWFESMAFRDGG
jgi:hypothetical protein